MPGWLQNRKDKSAKDKDDIPAQAVREVAPAAFSAPVIPPQTGLDAKTVAVIMAAVAAAEGKPVAVLRFTAIRREGRSLWAASGTERIIRDRQSFV